MVWQGDVQRRAKDNNDRSGACRLALFEVLLPTRLVAFDILQHDSLPFEKRYAKLLQNISTHELPIVIAPRVKCISKRHLTYALKSMISVGGEGIILRRPHSPYYHGRSTDLVKLKASRGDMEALVLRTKRKSIRLMIADGNILRVPLESVRCSPQVGDVVSFSYEQTAKRAMPANVKVYRIRKDLNWEIVLHNYRKENTELAAGPVSRVVAGMGPESLNYEGVENRKQMRRLLEDFARSYKLNPALAKSWYRLSKHFHLLKSVGKLSKWLQKYFQGSVVNALMHLFPEIGLVESNFAIAPRNYWSQVGNRRAFLENYARENNFDPLIPANWYSSYGDTFRLYKGGEGILSYYEGDYVQAILSIFPEIGLEEHKLSRKYWLEKKNQQSVLIEFAENLNIDPLLADSWYSVNPDLFYSSQSVASILKYYEGSHTKALVHLFPNIGLEEQLFGNYWSDYMHRKQLFVNYATSLGIQPQDPKMWESLNLVYLKTFKGVGAILRFYEGSIAKALVNLFPNIGLDEAKLYRKYEEDLANLRRAFGVFAREKGFDHLNPKFWYDADLTGIPLIEVSDSSLFDRRLKCIKLLFQAFPDIGLDKAKFGIGSGKAELDIKARRLFFTLYAKEKGFDPLVAGNWYDVPSSDITASKEGRAIATRYGGSIPKALLHLFPNIGLRRTLFSQRPLKLWRDVENKKQFFVNIAKVKGFDPLVASNWYRITLNDILSFKGSRSVIAQYDGNFVKALQVLFGFEFDEFKFITEETKRLLDVAQRRLFFDQFAEEHKFDPTIPANWYFVTLDSLLAKEGGNKVLQYYDKNVVEALRHVYPELDIDESRFVVLNPTYWLQVENRRTFFESFARDMGFDHLVAGNWHNLDVKALLRYKCAAQLLSDRPSIAKNLLHVFPSIGLDKSKFTFLPRNYWILDETQHKRELFMQFAKEKDFDPLVPQNWYRITESDVISFKHARDIISFKRSFANGLMAVLPDIGLEIEKLAVNSEDSKLGLVPIKHWQDINNQRNIFVKFAKQQGFDPLIAKNWYPISFEDMKTMKGVRAVRTQYKTLALALRAAFPGVPLDPADFHRTRRVSYP